MGLMHEILVRLYKGIKGNKVLCLWSKFLAPRNRFGEMSPNGFSTGNVSDFVH